jgi:RNA polymerase sigma-70 factor (ECF subfamily)
MRGVSPALRAAYRPDAPSDADCVRAVLEGDAEAFGTLVERYQHEYMRFAMRMLGTREDADEVLQAAFVRAYRALPQCRSPERFGAWLYRIVVNECRSRAARRGRRERWFVREDAALERAAARESNDGAALREEIQYALGELPAEQREAFVLKYVEELSYDEIAEITGVGVSALKMRVKRACDRLREQLQEVYSA